MKYFLTALLLLPMTIFGQDELITFQSDNLTLEGTLSIPNGNGPFPVVIIVHGSGPTDRHGTISLNDANSACLLPGLFGKTIRTYLDIADAFRLAGIAVLRYDKRSLTHGASLNPLTITPYDFITDIESAIDYVKTRSELNHDCIILAGHSQGSSLIPEAAKGRSDVAGLISLAGPVTPVDSLLPKQYRNIYYTCSMDTVSGDSVANQFYDQFGEIRQGTFPNTQQILVNFPGNPTNPLSFGFPTFWGDWMSLGDSVLANYNAAGLRTLIIQGDDDLNVAAEEADRFEAGLDPGLTTVMRFEGINHYLTPATDPNVSNAVLDSMINWILAAKPPTFVSPEVDDLDIELFFQENNLIVDLGKTDHAVNRIQVRTLTGQVVLDEEVGPIDKYTFGIPETKGVILVTLTTDVGAQTIRVYRP